MTILALFLGLVVLVLASTIVGFLYLTFRRDGEAARTPATTPTPATDVSSTPSASKGKLGKWMMKAGVIMFLIIMTRIISSYIPEGVSADAATDVVSEEESLEDLDRIVSEAQLDGTMDSYAEEVRKLGWYALPRVATHRAIKANKYGWYLAAWNAGFRHGRELDTKCVPAVTYEAFDQFGKSWRNRYHLGKEDRALLIWHRDRSGQRLYDTSDFTLSWTWKDDDKTGRAPRQQTYETVVKLDSDENYRLVWLPVLPGLIGGNKMHYRGLLDILALIDPDRLIVESPEQGDWEDVSHSTNLRNFPSLTTIRNSREKKIRMLVFNEDNDTGFPDFEISETNHTIRLTSSDLRGEDTLHINGKYYLVLKVRYSCTLHFTFQLHYDELS